MNETNHKPTVQDGPRPRPPYPGYDLPERFATADDIQHQVTREYAQNWLDRYAPGTQLSDLGTFALPEHFAYPAPARPGRRSAFAPGGNVSPTLPVIARRDGGQFSAVSDDDVAKALAVLGEAREDEEKSRKLVEQAQRESVQLQAAAEKRYAKFRKQRDLLADLVRDRDANAEHRKDSEDRLAELERARRTRLQVPVQPEFDPNGHVVVEYEKTSDNGRVRTKYVAVRRTVGRSFRWGVSCQDGTIPWMTMMQRVQNGEPDRQAALDSVKLIAYVPSPQAEGLVPMAPPAVRPRF